MIKYEPAKLIAKFASKKRIKKLLGRNLTVKKAALSFVDDIDFLDKKQILNVATKVVASYKKRVADDPDLKKEIIKDPKLLIQRVQNEVVFQVHDAIKEKYDGETATWLPSSADEPRPEHQLNYGKEYIIGEGIDGVEPGDEYGCQCGSEVHTKDSSLEL